MMSFTEFIKQLNPILWRFTFTVLGFATAISFLIFGFGKTMLVLICCVIGYFIGFIHDKKIDIIKLLAVLRNRFI